MLFIINDGYGQTVKSIDYYKYVILESELNIKDPEKAIKEIEEIFKKSSIPFSNSKHEVLNKGASEHEILNCQIYIQETFNGMSVINTLFLVFYDSKGNKITSLSAKGTGYYWVASKSIFKQLTNKFKNYQYSHKEQAYLAENNNSNSEQKAQIVYVSSDNEKYNYEPVSDIGRNIPLNNKQSDFSFALIIGNEDYASFQTDLSKEMNVEFARNDASAFKEYANKTLGIPERNITFLLDGTYGQISQALSKINLISKSTRGKATLYFYYAGHGLPDQNTKEAYIMPVDASSSNLNTAINLTEVYSKLSEYPNERVIVFLDACFTGGGREQGLLSARAVRVRPKENLLKGNITVFASSSGEQTSLPYKNQQHGLFTYFLLKKIQETKGELTLKELSDYLTEKVSLESILINNSEQTPKTNISHEIEDKWEGWKLIE